jgi:hypothetical protein
MMTKTVGLDKASVGLWAVSRNAEGIGFKNRRGKGKMEQKEEEMNKMREFTHFASFSTN